MKSLFRRVSGCCLVVACVVPLSALSQVDGALTGPFNPGRYPDSDYVIGHGASTASGGVSADQAIQAARDNARAEVARFFNVAVDSKFSSLLSHVCMTNDNSAHCQSVDSVKDVTTTRTSQVLEGVEIVATWREGDTYNAVAVLDKRKAAGGFSASIDALDVEIRALVGNPSADRGLVRLRNLNRAMLLHVVRSVQARKAALVGVVIASAPMTEAELLSMYQNALNYVPVALAGCGDPEIDDVLMAALTGRGIKIVANAVDAAVVIDCDMRSEREPGSSSGFVFSRCWLTLNAWEMFPAIGGAPAHRGPAVLRSVGANNREGHKDWYGAERRCKDKTVTAIKSEGGLADEIVAAIMTVPGGQK